MSLSKMESHMGFKKLKEQNEEADIISRLPDEVLCHILSLLPTLYAFYHLDGRIFGLLSIIFSFGIRNSAILDMVLIIKWNVENAFSILWNKYLIVVNPKISKVFYLRCSYIQASRRFSAWITFAVDHNVRNLELDIHIRPRRFPKLPPSLSTCKTLVELSLHKDFSFVIPDSVVCFPSLKILNIELSELQCPNAYLISKFIGSCSVLEELSLDGWLERSDDMFDLTFFIIVPTLKSLSIYLFGRHIFSMLIFYVRALNLDSGDDSLTCSVVNEIPFMDGIITDIRHSTLEVVSKDEANDAVELLKEINNITKYLSFSFRAMAALGLALNDDLPITFPNLIHLQLETEGVFGWKLLPHFLNNSPNLEVLVLEKASWVLTYEAEDGEELESVDFDWDEDDIVPLCLLSHLKLIMIKSMSWGDDDLDVVEYLLANSEVLEKFLVCTSTGREPQKEFLMFPRGSESCEIEFL